MDPEILAILCTPDTHEKLVEVSDEVLAEMNAKIAAGTVKTVGGVVVSECLEGALVSQDGKKLYPVKNGIPVLLPDEAIAVEI